MQWLQLLEQNAQKVTKSWGHKTAIANENVFIAIKFTLNQDTIAVADLSGRWEVHLPYQSFRIVLLYLLL